MFSTLNSASGFNNFFAEFCSLFNFHVDQVELNCIIRVIIRRVKIISYDDPINLAPEIFRYLL